MQVCNHVLEQRALVFVHFQGRRSAKPLAGVFIDIHGKDLNSVCAYSNRSFSVTGFEATSCPGFWLDVRSAGRRGRMDLVPLFVPTDVPLRDSPGPQKALKPLV